VEDNLKVQRIPVNIADEMRQSYLDYAMSVIIGRALPDVRDGLKPVHRRVLYAMYDLSNDWNRPYKKSARIVGDVIGKYHPHGDAAVYDTIVRMAQDFSMRYPLIDGQGNFGSMDGDPPAAMRYTEIRVTKIAGELLADIDRETVDFTPNYDDTTEEPEVLPSRIPNLIVNGSSGIAVGMSTNIPPHNLREVVDAIIALIKDPYLSVSSLMQYIPGPDFPTGAFIYGRSGIAEAYKTGKSIIQMRAQTFTEEDKRTGKANIIVSEIPFQLNKARLIERIADLVNEKRIEGIDDLRDESDRDGLRIMIELKRDAVPAVVLNQLYKLTPMQEFFGVIMLAIAEGRPRLLTLKDMLLFFLNHRRQILRKRTEFDLRKAEDRLHLLEGFKIALSDLDSVIRIIRQGQSPSAAREGLIRHFSLSENQAQAILEMRLQRLTQMEQEKLFTEHQQTTDLIHQLKDILANPQEIDKIIVEELQEAKERFANERRTQIVDETAEISIEDMIANEDMVVTISHEGYIKRNPVTLYRAQRRGGKGVIGLNTREKDFAESLFIASTHSPLLFFTNAGRVYQVKVHELPQAGRAARGKAVINLLHLSEGERLSASLPVREFQEDHFIVFATRKGIVKKTELMAYANPRRGGMIAIALGEGDEVIGVKLTDGRQHLLLSTGNGQAIRFSEEEVRPTSRGTYGVRGITLEEKDEVVSLEILGQGATILTASSRGYGKRSVMDEYRVQSRGGKGVITMRTTDKIGEVIRVQQVTDDDEMILVTDKGRIIRLRVNEIRVTGRNTQGVRLIEIGPDERVASLARLAEKEEGEEIH
jgi:DNA gyrase subunit A